MAEAPEGPDRPTKPSNKSEPQEQLPTDRISFEKQLRLLQAYAAVSDGGRTPVNNDDVGGVVEMSASTVSLANTFFVKTGFLLRSGRGYVPAREVVEYQNAYAWSPDTAAHKLAPIIEKSWFWAAMRPKLLMRAVEESEAISDLAQKAMVGPENRPQLRMLVNYVVAVGLVRRDGDRLALDHRTAPPARTPTEAPPQPEPARAPIAASSAKGDLSHLHPFVQGLLVTLPNEGEEWPAQARAKWLQAAENIFGLIYVAGGAVKVLPED